MTLTFQHLTRTSCALMWPTLVSSVAAVEPFSFILRPKAALFLLVPSHPVENPAGEVWWGWTTAASPPDARSSQSTLDRVLSGRRDGLLREYAVQLRGRFRSAKWIFDWDFFVN